MEFGHSKVYSINGEDFHHDSVDEAVEALLELENDREMESRHQSAFGASSAEDKRRLKGRTRQLWEGDAVKRPASEYLPDIVEAMQDRAYDEVGEHSDGWEFSKEQTTELQEVVAKAVDQWATANNMQPHFYQIINATPFHVKFTDNKGGYVVEPPTES